MMTLEQIRLKQNPVLTSILLGMGQGSFVAEFLFPRLPQALRGATIASMGNEKLRRYNLRRAPGSNTKRIEVKWEGNVYVVDQHSVEVPIPRELIQEQQAAQGMNVAANLDISTVAMATANDVLLLDYEIEAAEFAAEASNYASGNVLALSGGTKWSAATGTPVTDIRAAAEVIRKKAGVRPNKLLLSADALSAIVTNAEVRGYLPSTQMGPATIDQLKTLFNVAAISVGDAIWVDPQDVATDVWGNNAILSYSPDISGAAMSLAQPAFGFTSVLPGHPFAEKPYYSDETKSYVYGATFERKVNFGKTGAGFLFQNCK